MPKDYAWKRFWYRPGTPVNRDVDGYLLDPESAQYPGNPDVVPFEDISTVQCLILLGEPGAGKSVSLYSEYESIQKDAAEGVQAYWLDLGIKGEGLLVQELREAQEIIGWVENKHDLHLFLDSFDECQSKLPRIIELLTDEINQFFVKREHLKESKEQLQGSEKNRPKTLYLRIICRTAKWHQSFEESLKALKVLHNKDDGQIKVYQLAPLRQLDVSLAAEQHGINHAEFLRAIKQRGIALLAISPIELEPLLDIYKAGEGQIPSTQVALYLDRCKRLCGEWDARLGHTLEHYKSTTRQQRLAIAARIAAITIFSGRPLIYNDVNYNLKGGHLAIETLAGGIEHACDDPFYVSEETIQETLGIGLFSFAQNKLVTWAHRTYSEFLAAWYLAQNMGTEQIESLIFHSNVSESKVLPQLSEIAAWLAAMVPHVFNKIVCTDPEILLQSDVAIVDFKSRARLVEALLELYSGHEHLMPAPGSFEWYRKLDYVGLDQQISRYLGDDNSAEVRSFAIKVASACKFRSLKDDLAEMALDRSLSIFIRTDAAEAVIQIGDESAKGKLKPLAFGEAGEDPADELKGAGLKAVWPHHMTIEEVLRILTPPKAEHFLGEYEYFIKYHLPQNLTAPDVITAMKWLLRHCEADKPPFPLIKLLADLTIVKSFSYIKEPGVLPVLRQALLSRLERSFEIVGFEAQQEFMQAIENDDIRRTILDAVIPNFLNFEINLARLIVSKPSLIFSRDIPWMFEYLNKIDSDSAKGAFAALICRIVDVNDSTQMQFITKASQEDNASSEVFRLFLSSLEAEQQKTISEKQHQETATTSKLSLEELNRLLKRCESGQPKSWINLTEELVKPYDAYQDPESRFILDITTLRGWDLLDEQTRARIIAVARTFLLDQNPDSEASLGFKFSLKELAGMKALILLRTSDHIAEVTADTWKRWAPVVIAHPVFGDDTSTTLAVHQDLVGLTYHFSPNETIESLEVLIDNEDKQHSFFSSLQKFEKCWDERLSNAVLSKAKDRNLSPNGVAYLLDTLIDRNFEDARQLAKSLVSPPRKGFSSHTPSKRSHLLMAAYVGSALLMRANDPLCLTTWSVMMRYPQLGRAVFAILAKNHKLDSFKLDQLAAEQLANLYTWLVEQYPYEKDSDIRDAHYITARESIAQFRNSILRRLSQAGTQKAVAMIQKMLSASPSNEHLEWALQESRNFEVYHAWSPLDPKTVVDLATNKEKRLVKDGHDLLHVLVESLRRLQKELYGETPAVYFLWDKIGDTFRPKTEPKFSDWIKLHLERDLKQREIIALREVEIRRTGPKSKGQQPDIYVRARSKSCDNKNDSITAIVEVKGSWNQKLEDGIKKQLVGRYLKNYECSYGLYVICSVSCEQWDSSDWRKARTPKKAEKIQRKYDSIAQELSTPGTLVKAFVIDAALPKDATI